MRLILIFCWCGPAFAQTAPIRPFEAVSIRPHEGGMRTLTAQISGSRLSWEAANLRGC
jgi:hypothetical protein